MAKTEQQIQLDRLHAKLDKVVESIHSIDKTLAVNTASLEEHVKRTNLLQTKVEALDDKVKSVKTGYKVVMWIIGAIAAVATFFKNILE